MRTCTRLLALTLGVLGTGTVAALEIDGYAHFTTRFTTNTNLLETSQREFITVPGISALITHDTDRLAMEGNYSASRRLYTRRFHDDENVVTGTSIVHWRPLPRYLDVRLNHARYESSRNLNEPFVQSNRQFTDRLEVGPMFHTRVRRTDELQLEYNFVDYNASRTLTNADEEQVLARYIFGFQAPRRLTLEGYERDIDFDNPDSPDIDETTFTGRFRQIYDRSRISLWGGHTLMERTLGRTDVDGAIGGFNISVSPWSDLEFRARGDRQIRYRSERLELGTEFFGEVLEEDTEVNEVFEQDSATLSATRLLSGSIATLYVNWSNTDFIDIPRDRKSWRTGLAYGRLLNRSMIMRSSLIYQQTEFTEGIFEDHKGVRLNAEVNWRVARRWDLDFGAGLRRRIQQGRTFTELVGHISFVYSLRDRRIPRDPLDEQLLRRGN